MRVTVAPDIYVVVAKKDNAIEYWAAASDCEKAAALKRDCRAAWAANAATGAFPAGAATDFNDAGRASGGPSGTSELLQHRATPFCLPR
jgi:hypothetical protein